MSHFAKHMKRLTGPFNLEQSKNGALLIGFCDYDKGKYESLNNIAIHQSQPPQRFKYPFYTSPRLALGNKPKQECFPVSLNVTAD